MNKRDINKIKSDYEKLEKLLEKSKSDCSNVNKKYREEQKEKRLIQDCFKGLEENCQRYENELYELGQTILKQEKENAQLKWFIDDIKKDFKCFAQCLIRFHVGSKEELPHSMADLIEDYCNRIIEKLDTTKFEEVLLYKRVEKDNNK